VILLIFITKILYNVCFALHEFSSVADIRDGICKVPMVISALQSNYCHQFLQSTYCYQCFAMCLLSSVLCKVPIVISALQCAYCHQCFALHLLSSTLWKAPVVIVASQSILKEWNTFWALRVLLAVIVKILPEDAGSIFLWNICIYPPQIEFYLLEYCYLDLSVQTTASVHEWSDCR
jgi:hypothetical protein